MIKSIIERRFYLIGEVIKSESHRVNRVSSTKAMVCIIEATATAGTVGAVYLQATTKCCVFLQPSEKAVVTSF